MKMRVLTLLTALTTFALFDVALGDRHRQPAWKKHRRQYGPIDSSGYKFETGGGYGGASADDATKAVQGITGREFELQKRYDNSRFSFYDAGLGACGIVNSGKDFIVALNSAQFDSGHHCFEQITIMINGKSTQATITDRCPGCPYGGLDFSRGLFKFFAEEQVGILHGAWTIGGGAPPPPPPPPPPMKVEVSEPKPSPPPPPPPPPPPSPSPSPEPSSIPTSNSTLPSSLDLVKTSTSGSSATSTSSSSNTPAPSATWKPEEHKGCIENLDMAMIHLGAMIVSGAKVGEIMNSAPSPAGSDSSVPTPTQST